MTAVAQSIASLPRTNLSFASQSTEQRDESVFYPFFTQRRCGSTRKDAAPVFASMTSDAVAAVTDED